MSLKKTIINVLICLAFTATANAQLVSGVLSSQGTYSSGTLTFHRPDNVTAYVAGLTVADSSVPHWIVIPIAKNTGRFSSIQLATNDTASKVGSYRLWILNIPDTTSAYRPFKDGEPFRITDTLRSYIKGYATFKMLTTSSISTITYSVADTIQCGVWVIQAGKPLNLYGILEARSAWAPMRSANYFIKYDLIQ